MSLTPGHRLGPYEILAPLGAGGMGEVYRARDPRLERTVAIKVLPPRLAEDEGYRRRFQREARAASALCHPNIAQVYDVGQQDGTHFIVMEYVEGESLRSLVSRGPLGPDRVADLGEQMAAALDEAHARSIVHRDIKSANAVVSASGQVKVLDFGLARLKRDDAAPRDSQVTADAPTEAGAVLGTVPYMSPEQALGKEVDARTDIFSLGVVLYELATGRLPFSGDTAAQTIDQICHATPGPISARNSKAPEELERIVRKCLEKDRDRRYATAKDLLVDLRNLRRDRESGAGAAAPGPASTSRRRLLAVIGIVAVLGAGALLARLWLFPAAAAIDSLAVLPFRNETGDPEIDYLTSGLTESLINTLSQLPGVRVTSRTSAFVFKDSQADLGAIARKLGVRALLLGRLARRAGELSISAELVDAEGQRQLWGDRYRLDASDVAKVEGEMAETIARTLTPRLAGAASREVARPRATDPEAYRLYLKGRLFTAGTRDEMRQATRYFQQALERDPLYALAHVGLAESYATQAYLLSENREETVRKARAAARRALEIEPGLADGLAVSGLIRLYFEWDIEGAGRDLREALRKNPGSAMAYEEYTNVLVAAGRSEESLAVALQAKKLDPLSVLPTHQLGITYMHLGRFEEAAREFQEAQGLRPGWVWGYIKRGKALAHLGRCEEARKEAARGEEIVAKAENESAWSWIAFVYAKCGDEGRAREYLRRMQELERRRFVDPLYVAIVHAGLGEEAATLERLEQAYEARSPWMFSLEGFPRFYSLASLAADPRFQDLLRRVQAPRALDDGQKRAAPEG